MNDDALRVALATEAHAAADIDPADAARPLPWDPEWTVAGVLGHLGGVQRWATALCVDPSSRARRRDLEAPPEGEAVVGWFAAGVAPMLDVLSDPDLETAVHTWAGEQPRRWWLRRLTHETAVHRWDVESGTVGIDAARPIDPAVAVDGIDELFENFLPLVSGQAIGRGETLHVHATDADGEWQLTFRDPGIAVERAHAKADVAVRGRASDLLLFLWNRIGADSPTLEVFGECDVLTLWRRSVQF